MQPFYYDYKWKTEEKFIELIDKSKKFIFGLKMAIEIKHFFLYLQIKKTNKFILCRFYC